MTWFTDKRIEWIRESLTIFGAVNREHIQKKFGASIAQASCDLREAQKKWPKLMKYNTTTKQYELAK